MKTTAIIAAVLLACTALPATAQLRVVDGDTIVLDNQRIRLWGIDAPEKSQTCEGHDGDTYMCGQDSTAVLVALTNNHTVTCVERDVDRYKRSVAICSTEAGELNAAMVRQGWAVDYVQYSHGAYATEQAAAKAEGLGIWSGRFTMPADYRHGNRSDNSSGSTGGTGYGYHHIAPYAAAVAIIYPVMRSVMRSYQNYTHQHYTRSSYHNYNTPYHYRRSHKKGW